jgi:hypothetical protein
MSGLFVTRAKFACREIVPSVEGVTILLEAVTSGSPENREFFKYTPSGQIRMGVIGNEVARQFEVGREYYVDFTPAPEMEFDRRALSPDPRPRF